MLIALSLALLLHFGQTEAAPPLQTDQSALVKQATDAFNSQHYAQALPLFQRLMKAAPTNDIYAKYAAEAAISAGDTPFAIATLTPIEQRSPDDWQAMSILAHAYALAGNQQQRDAEIAKLVALHDRPGSPLAGHRDFLLETVKVGDQQVAFYPAFAPWGPYRVHLIARVYDAVGKPGLRITLESGDIDQPAFAKQHPAEAAKGMRAFTLDGYAPDRKDDSGAIIQTHFTYAFLVGKPDYDMLRQNILDIVAGKLKPMSSRVGPVSGQ